MADIIVRREGKAGCITLNRPEALNALTYDMCLEIKAALEDWRTDADIAILIFDATGDRAFCAGGDIVEMYETGKAGNFAYGQKFWADEYRMNAALAKYPKPIVSFLQGFTMGGGVGVGCHASHRIVGESSQIAMPECGIGLVPDVGGTAILARAPGRLGAYFGTTGARMGPGDAILTGFGDTFIPEGVWSDLKTDLIENGDPGSVKEAAKVPPPASISDHQDEIDRLFAGADAAAILDRLETAQTPLAETSMKAFQRSAPLSVAATLRMLNTLGPAPSIEDALRQEYRFTARAAEKADFIEGIRAQIIDKDRNPQWRHASVREVSAADIT
ncbi:MAG: enoyl-CoA hydratase/isomerase family protein, partial [Pseudomonadota bacterium]